MKYAVFVMLLMGCAAMVMHQGSSHTQAVVSKKSCPEQGKECANASSKTCCMQTQASLQGKGGGEAQPAEKVKFFEGSWNELLAAAEKEKKPFWVDVYTTWCGPCKTMAKFTFTDDEVGKISNAGFLSYKLDAEKGEGVKLASQYNVDAYPTILFFGADGKLLGREVGLQDAERFAYNMGKYGKKKGKTKKPKK